ncbi:MAG: TIGR04002 family protein [Ruminococcus sp.]|nr:TIGR04002 family protein [Ruminococcus sp.]
MTRNDNKLRLITLTAVFAALIYVLTAFLHVPTIKGYVHIGDGVIFLAASILPTPYAAAAAAIGAGLSDALSGYFIWVPATIVIKALTTLAFTNKSEHIIGTRNLLALIPALILCVGGYGLYSGLVIYHSLAAGFADAAANTVQIVASSIVFVLAGTALDRTKAVKRVKKTQKA